MTSDVDSRLSAALADRYRIGRELGGGGMSRVFVATETALGREVVIKVIKPELLEGLSAERFAREVQLAARLQQANIVPVLAAGDADGVPWYSMPFIRGESLRARLARGDEIPVGEAVSILRDVARALAFAHGEGVVHRDIKPDNILLSGATAVVADFGIAKAMRAARTLDGSGHTSGDLTMIGNAIGTPAYMAPEQVAGDPTTDHRADLYAWGVVAWELLAGRHPFAERVTPQALLAAHMAETPAPLTAMRPGLSPALAALVARCLEKDPARRPSSATEILQQIDLVSTPSVTPEPTPKASRFGSSARWIVVGSTLVAVATVSWWATRSRNPNGDASATRTIVVMPFDNLGPPSDAYFADGVSEEIASRLGQIPGMRVVGRASAARFKASNRSAEDIGRELGADYVLTGSVRWDRGSGTQASGATVRITPALIRARTGERLWGEPVTEKLTDVFKVQADVAERVATALSVSLAATTRTSIHRADTQDPEAREAALLGWNLVSRRGEANISQAIVQFRRAIARDSMYARAWAGLAEAEAVGPTYGVASADSTGRAARRAVALDSLSSEAWVALASTLTFEVRFREALAAADRAVALDPSSAAAHSRRGMVLLAMGRVHEAEGALRSSTRLDPLVAAFEARMIYLDMALSNRDSMVGRIGRVRALDPQNNAFMFLATGALVQLGLVPQAIDACATRLAVDVCKKQVEDFVNPKRRAALLAFVDAYPNQAAPSLLVARSFRAAAYAHLGESDKAFAMLREAFESSNDRMLFGYINSPWLEPLRKDPRWQSIVVAGRNR